MMTRPKSQTLRVLLSALLLVTALIGGLLAFYGAELIEAFTRNGISTTSRVVYGLIGVAALVAALFIFAGESVPIPGKIGRSSGDNRGPDPGDGSVIHHSSGEADFDGLSGDRLPQPKGAERDLPYPPGRDAD